MDDESVTQQVLHLHEVEKLSQRQIAQKLHIGRRRIVRILSQLNSAKPMPRATVLDEYMNLMAHWYKEYPRLKAIQVYERLLPYGYQGSYQTVVRLSKEYRKPKRTAYHALTFVPGEEAQIDWFFFKHEKLGQVAGFLYVLSYSRYAWGVFYPKTTFEFFLAGHIECFKHIGGLAHSHRYDNVKSVVLSRQPTIQYNPKFLDFSRFYGFSICLCNPYKGNEKGRVERIIRDIRATFLYAEEFVDLKDLNQKFHQWLKKRNDTIHRSTSKTPQEHLGQERLIGMPKNDYLPRRVIQAVVSKTAFVEFDSNKYSVPSVWASKAVEIIAYPDTIEIYDRGSQSKKISTHRRCFDRKKVIENPLHAERILDHTPKFKMQRIEQLMINMNPVFNNFIHHQDDEQQRSEVAYQLFQLMKTHSRVMLISAVKELNSMQCFKIKALRSLLQLPESRAGDSLWPQNTQLLNLSYEQRSLHDYDPDSEAVDPT